MPKPGSTLRHLQRLGIQRIRRQHSSYFRIPKSLRRSHTFTFNKAAQAQQNVKSLYFGLNSHTWARQSAASHAGQKLCWLLEMFTLLTVDRHTHRYIIKAVCFAGKMIPHTGFLGVGGEDILKGVFSGNDQKAELCGEWEYLGAWLSPIQELLGPDPIFNSHPHPHRRTLFGETNSSPPHSLPCSACPLPLSGLLLSEDPILSDTTFGPWEGAWDRQARPWAAVPGRDSLLTLRKSSHQSQWGPHLRTWDGVSSSEQWVPSMPDVPKKWGGTTKTPLYQGLTCPHRIRPEGKGGVLRTDRKGEDRAWVWVLEMSNLVWGPRSLIVSWLWVLTEWVLDLSLSLSLSFSFFSFSLSTPASLPLPLGKVTQL